MRVLLLRLSPLMLLRPHCSESRRLRLRWHGKRGGAVCVCCCVRACVCLCPIPRGGHERQLCVDARCVVIDGLMGARK